MSGQRVPPGRRGVLRALGGLMLTPLAARPGQARPRIGGPYVLHDPQGRRVTERTYRGAWQIVFFGFTNCPDVCPTAMLTLSSVLPKLQAPVPTRGVFITVDPGRDTAAQLTAYMSNFDSRIVALRGSDAETAAAAKAFQARYSVTRLDGDYAVTHSGYIYVLDPQGRLVRTLRYDLTAEDMLAELMKLGVGGAPMGGSHAGG